MATTMAMETVLQTEHSYQSEQRVLKKKTTRRHTDQRSISVSKSSARLHKKLKAAEAEAGAEACAGAGACASCGRAVYAAERVHAERRLWHADCFRCAVCEKRLTVETYESAEGVLYCRAHHRQRAAPPPPPTPAADDCADDERDAGRRRRRQEPIVCESYPEELPADVVRASDKPGLGLEELSQLDVRARFELFERRARGEEDQSLPETRDHGAARRETSRKLLSRIAKCAASGLDVGGTSGEPCGSDKEDDDEDSVLKKSYLVGAREQPVPACNMTEIMDRFESGPRTSSDRHNERKQEIQNIRSRLFMGKQAKIKEMYEQSVLQSEQGVTSSERARSPDREGAREGRAAALRERFERGEPFGAGGRDDDGEGTGDTHRDIDDSKLFDEGIGKRSRSLFQELDAQARGGRPLESQPASASTPPRRRDQKFAGGEGVGGSRDAGSGTGTADVASRFQFFETYRPEVERKQFRMTPPRETQGGALPREPSPEPYREPLLVRSDLPAPDTGLANSRRTAQRMISVFRDMEERQHMPAPSDRGPKPLKQFTPPPVGERSAASETASETGSDSGSDSEEERRARYREAYERDEALRQAQQLARARSFRDRFERGPSPPAPRTVPSPDEYDDGDSQLETAKSLRDKFENLRVAASPRVPQPAHPAPRRFV